MKHEIKTYIRDDETVVETYIFEDGVTLSYEPENADCGVNVYGRYAFIWCDYHEFRFDGTTYTMRRLPDNEFVEVPNPGFHAACRVLKLWLDEFESKYSSTFPPKVFALQQRLSGNDYELHGTLFSTRAQAERQALEYLNAVLSWQNIDGFKPYQSLAAAEEYAYENDIAYVEITALNPT